MTILTAVLLVAALGVALVDWLAVARDHLGAEFVAKPTVMVLLIAAVLSVPDHTPLHTWMIVGLALSLLGDIVLMLPNGPFEGGLAAFLLAHIAYIVAFGQADTDRPWLAVGIVVAIVGCALLGSKIIRAAASKSGAALGGAVALYIAAIGTMAASGFGTGAALVAVSVVLFMVSDALLGWGRFIGKLPFDRVAVHVTYHLAQIGFVLWLA